MDQALILTFLFAVQYLYLLCSSEAIIWKVIIGPLHLGYIPCEKSCYISHAVNKTTLLSYLYLSLSTSSYVVSNLKQTTFSQFQTRHFKIGKIFSSTSCKTLIPYNVPQDLKFDFRYTMMFLKVLSYKGRKVGKRVQTELPRVKKIQDSNPHVQN